MQERPPLTSTAHATAVPVGVELPLPAVVSRPSRTEPPRSAESSQRLAGRAGGADLTRDPWWDNARCLSAMLIVILHTVGSVMAQHHLLQTYNVGTWALRVPLFVVLAGVFSKAAPPDARRLRGIVQSIALPAALFSLLYSVEVVLLGNEFKLHVVQLPWTLWFLMSLICWRLLLPIVVLLRYPLLITTVVSLSVGYVEELGMVFSASRTLVYMPLFLIGWKIGQGSLRSWFNARWSLPVAVAGLVAAALFGWFGHEHVKGRWLSMRHPYTAADPLGLYGAWVVRACVLAGAVALVLCLFRVMPRRRIPFVSALGAAGFTVYLLHPLVILPVRETGWISRANTPAELVGLVLCGVVLTGILGSAPVRRLVRPLTKPPVGWLFGPSGNRGAHAAKLPSPQT